MASSVSAFTERCPHCGLNHEPGLAICPATGLAIHRDVRAVRRAVIPVIGAVLPRAPARKREKAKRPLLERVIDGRYRVMGLIGEGGMGAVYEAEDLERQGRVAVKVLHPDHVAKKEAESRLRHEARVVSALGHPSICAIHDVGRLDDGSPYLVMERLEGTSLAGRIEREGALDPSVLIDLMAQVLSALGTAHARGVIHRDLKPDNIFLVRQSSGRTQAKLLDFGISKASGIDDTAVDLTRTGMVMGTPYYMAPEQARGDRTLDHRVDLWAVGVILYEALTGRRPFVARNYNALLVQILTAKPRPIRELNPHVSEELAAVVSRALSKMREDRQQSAPELDAALQACRAPVSASEEPVESKTLARGRKVTERMDPEGLRPASAPRAPKPAQANLEGGLPRQREVPRPSAGRRSSIPPRGRVRASPVGGRRRSSIPPPEDSLLGDSSSEDPTIVMSRNKTEFLDFTEIDDRPAGANVPIEDPPAEDEDTERTIVDPPSFATDTPTLRGGDRRK